MILRARLLLQKQNKLSLLEDRLERIDQEETLPLFLGSNRLDENEERQQVISKIDTALADYGPQYFLCSSSLCIDLTHDCISDAFVTRSQQILKFSAARSRDVSSLQNWVEGTGSLARDETAYLERGTDLMSIVSVEDDALGRCEASLENVIVQYFKRFRKVRGRLSLSQVS